MSALRRELEGGILAVPPRHRRCGQVGEGGQCRPRAGWKVGGRRRRLRRGFLGAGLRLLRRRMECGKCMLVFSQFWGLET